MRLTATAKHRHTEAPKLIHLMRGDLDWIVMKCLEKDRTRRYETANGLAADIQRHLDNEPVIARPPSVIYSLQKSVRRNKTVFAALTAVAAVLVVGVVASTLEAIRATRAEREQSQLRQEAETARAREATLREQAQAGEKFAEAELLCQRDKLDEAQKMFDSVPMTALRLYPARATDALNTLGGYHVSHGQWQGAVSNFTLLIELNPDDHLNYHALVPLLVQIGDVETYRQLCREALVRFNGTKDPNIAERMAKDCLILPDVGVDLDEVGKWVETALTVGKSNEAFAHFQCVKGLAEYRQGHYEGAIDWTQRGLPALSQGPGSLWFSVEAHMVTAMSRFRLKQTDAARSELAKWLEIAETKASPITRQVLFKDKERAWADWIIAHALMNEAQALLEDQTNATATEAKPEPH